MVPDSGLARRDRQAYALAFKYLTGLDGVTRAMVECYLMPDPAERPMVMDGLQGIYRLLVFRLQNWGMAPHVVGGAIGGVNKLSPLLGDFKTSAVIRKYGHDCDRLLQDIRTRLKPRGEIRTERNSIWPRYCKSLLSAAAFLAQFGSSEEFYEWIDFFDKDVRARPSLPMLLSAEIDGLGFALACDFLMGLGYENFCKPDVHLKKMFSELELSPGRGDYEVFKAVTRVASSVGIRPFNVDQIFWLIGSGNFHRHGLKVGGHREQFITYAKKRLRTHRTEA
jgi:hypothetical protein